MRRALVVTGGVALGLVLVYRLRATLTPIFLGFLIAYGSDPLVDRLEAKKVPRAVGAVLVLSAMLTLGALFVVFFVPAIVSDLASFAATLPDQIDRSLGDLEPWVRRTFDVEIPRTFEEAMDRWGAEIQASAPRIAGAAGLLVGDALGGVVSILGFVLTALLVPVFAFYLLVDFDRLVVRARGLVPPRSRARVGLVVGEIDRTMAAFFRGQLTNMILQAVLYATGLGLLGVPLGIGIGLMTGLLLFVPYVGVGTGFALALAMSMLHFHGWFTPLGVVVLYGAINLLDAVLFTPRIVGGKVGLGPVAVIASLMAFGELFGFLGVLLAVPMAAVAKILLKEGIAAYRGSDLFGTEAERTADSAPVAVPAPAPATEEP